MDLFRSTPIAQPLAARLRAANLDECVGQAHVAARGRPWPVGRPPGGGRSLCTQGPPIVSDDTTLVVSPLISLMKDQVDSLLANGIAAAAANSTHSAAERLEVADGMRSGRLKLLYLSPERLCAERTLAFLEDCQVFGRPCGFVFAHVNPR